MRLLWSLKDQNLKGINLWCSECLTFKSGALAQLFWASSLKKLLGFGHWNSWYLLLDLINSPKFLEGTEFQKWVNSLSSICTPENNYLPKFCEALQSSYFPEWDLYELQIGHLHGPPFPPSLQNWCKNALFCALPKLWIGPGRELARGTRNRFDPGIELGGLILDDFDDFLCLISCEPFISRPGLSTSVLGTTEAMVQLCYILGHDVEISKYSGREGWHQHQQVRPLDKFDHERGVSSDTEDELWMRSRTKLH